MHQILVSHDLRLEEPDISIGASHHIASALITIYCAATCSLLKVILQVTVHCRLCMLRNATLALHSHEAPQKQRVSSIVALQCKAKQDQESLNPAVIGYVPPSSGRQREHALCPQNLLASMLPSPPGRAAGNLTLMLGEEVQMQ